MTNDAPMAISFKTSAPLAKLVDARDLKSRHFGGPGSSPGGGTIFPKLSSSALLQQKGLKTFSNRISMWFATAFGPIFNELG